MHRAAAHDEPRDGRSDVELPNLELPVTEACNNRCAFCTTGALNAAGAEETLTHVPRERLRAQLAEGYRNGARRVVLHGGEPTVRRDLGELVADAKELGYLATTIFTNGRMAASEAGARWLAGMGVTWFQISIQGGNAAAHDASVGAPTAFKQTIAGTRRLLALGQRVKVNSVLTRHLLESIEDYARLMIELRPEELGLDTVKTSAPLATSGVLYRELVPRFATYAERLRDAMLAMERAGLVARLTSFAPCLAPGAEHLANEEAPTTQSVGMSGRSLNKHLWKRGMQVKAESCARCAYDDVCGGVYAEYGELHGLGELRPYDARVSPPPVTAPVLAPPLPDPEWTALQASLKPAVRMTMAEPRARALADRMRSRGLACALGETTKPGEIALYVARDRGRVEAIVAAERATMQGASVEARLAGHEALGALLGYPSCCVAAFVARARTFDGPGSPLRVAHEDVVHARAALAAVTSMPRAHANSLLWGSRRHLVTFYPCAFDCVRAVRYAMALERELAKRAPAATEALMRDLAGTVALDVDGARAIVLSSGAFSPPPAAPGTPARTLDVDLAARLEAGRQRGEPLPDSVLRVAFSLG